MVGNAPHPAETKASLWLSLCRVKAGRRMLQVVRKTKTELPASAKAQNIRLRHSRRNFHRLPYDDAPRKSLWRGTAT